MIQNIVGEARPDIRCRTPEFQIWNGLYIFFKCTYTGNFKKKWCNKIRIWETWRECLMFSMSQNLRPRRNIRDQLVWSVIFLTALYVYLAKTPSQSDFTVFKKSYYGIDIFDIFKIKTLGLSLVLFGNFYQKFVRMQRLKCTKNWIHCSVVSFPGIHYSELLNFFYLNPTFLIVNPKAMSYSLCTTSGGWNLA